MKYPKAPSVIDEVAGRRNGGGSWQGMETIWSNLVVGDKMIKEK